MTLIFEDDKYDAKVGVSAYQKLRNIDGVDAVVAVSAPVLEALKPLVKKDNVLLFSLGESLFHEDDTVFQLMPAGDKIGPRLGEEASKRYRRIAVVYSQGGSLWVKWRDEFKKGLSRDSVIEEFPLPSNSDLKTETLKVLAFKPDATTVFMPLEDGTKYLQALKLYDTHRAVHIICDSNLEFSINQYIKAVGAEIFNGCISTALPDTKTAEFINIYKSKFNADPIITSDYAYDAVSIVGELSQRNKNQWLDFLKNNFDFHGASGEIRFNEFGTRMPEVVVHQFSNGQFK